MAFVNKSSRWIALPKEINNKRAELTQYNELKVLELRIFKHHCFHAGK
jgi:hypothetical protein